MFLTPIRPDLARSVTSGDVGGMWMSATLAVVTFRLSELGDIFEI